ncbi:MAG: hypothetical protein GX603_01115 [Chloroflexi bacterium]|nr:hypothetical protein [Chloroflexota bacterium]
MKSGKKLLALLVISLLATLMAGTSPTQSQAITDQPKLVVFESVGSIE